MSVLVYAETENGKFRKHSFEVASYAAETAKKMGVGVAAIALGAADGAELGTYGVGKVLNVKDPRTNSFNAKAFAYAIAKAAEAEKADVIILGSSSDCKYLAPLLAANLKAGYVPNVVALPESTAPFKVRRTVFSNKGFAHTEIGTEKKIIGVSSNAHGALEHKVEASVTAFDPGFEDKFFNVKVKQVDRATGKITIADADIVVAGGRGLKGPENWGMIEDLAEVLGAATACSKPVSDMGWRPHSEHVGQTGKQVACNLYIAIGISGAIQHLAGVSASKVKVVINIDPEAPFFKAADYGIVGDAFEVVPLLTEKLREFKAQNT